MVEEEAVVVVVKAGDSEDESACRLLMPCYSYEILELSVVLLLKT